MKSRSIRIDILYSYSSLLLSSILTLPTLDILLASRQRSHFFREKEVSSARDSGGF
jgi:hypothetical protein